MRTIALIEIGNDGHREAYMRYFIAALLELNCRVVCLIPDPAPIQHWIELYYPQHAQRVLYGSLPFHRERFRRTGIWKERLNVLYNWYTIQKSISQIERMHSITIDLVFLNYLDPYLINYTPAFLLNKLLHKKWAGLYCFPAALRLSPGLLKEKPVMADRDIMMTSGNCVAITFHDEDLVADFARRIGKKVILFPEIADLSVPEKSYPLELLIQKLARGRVVVGNIGLEKHKGNYEFMQLAKFANPDQYFFVFTGRDDGTLFQFLKEGQTDEFKHFISQLPENCIWAPAHFEDELEYNAVVAAFDILYMIYTHFYGSSNRLTKAVFFQKPVLADAQYCIGNTVKKYRLGEVVPDTRPETLLTALEKLKERLGQQAISEHDRQTYLQQNSAGVLTERFRELLELI